MAFELEYWPIFVVVLGAVLVVLFLLYATRMGEKKKKGPLETPPAVKEAWPVPAERTVTADEAKRARDDLRMLDLEREILSYAIRRLYEAHAEGKISEEERESLAHRYKSRMMTLKKTISRSETMVALHELEAMRADLIKLFSERFDDVNTKIDEFRSRIEVKPVVETPPVPPPAPPTKGKKAVRRRPPPPTKTEAEKRIEEIKAEVEKVLQRLGQIEAEA